MPVCPNCRDELVRTKHKQSMLWACPSCGGRVVTMPVWGYGAGGGILQRLWMRARGEPRTQGRPCPMCEQPMAEVRGSTAEACDRCRIVWFDAEEFGTLPNLARMQDDKYRGFSPKAREAVAAFDTQHAARLKKHEWIKGLQEDVNEGPDTWWKYALVMLGFPVEEGKPLISVPWLTWSLILVISLISVMAFGSLEQDIMAFGLIPAQALRYGGLTFLTCFFLHGGVMHLVGNMYFLLIFGDNVEDFLGRWRYAVLLFGAAVIGGIAHVLADPSSTIPCVGASGGISGIMAFYALKFPSARIVIMVWYRFIRVPAVVAFVFWILLQLLTAWMQSQGISNVAAMAHLGGVATGVAAWLFWRGRASMLPSRAGG
jgi:membrane associated rhomboid family serine protease/Zn-finger nucleic acid-binding protein